MLPPRLCDDLCSLVQGEPRLTMLCRMTIAPTGDVVGAQLARAVIVSRRRLDYPTVQALLEHGQSTGDAEVDAMLREAAQLAELLRRKRFELGALDLDVPELRVRLDEHGHVVGFTREVSDDSHRLIEEMMLAANEQVARLLRERGLPAIYRVHEEPAADKWRDLVHTLREYGISVPPTPGRRETARIMELIRGHAEEERLKMLVLRAMMRARYAPRPLGHFGLAKSDYCHFTSPIRRYADLVVHRSVARLTDRRSSTPLPDAGRLQHLTDHLSDAERRSAAAELEATRLKLMAYLAEQAASPHPTAWDAVVCGVWAHGLAVELTELRLRGYVPAAALPRRAGWHYAGREWRNSQIALAEGAHLAVVPHAVEWESQSVEFAPADLYE